MPGVEGVKDTRIQGYDHSQNLRQKCGLPGANFQKEWISSTWGVQFLFEKTHQV